MSEKQKINELGNTNFGTHGADMPQGTLARWFAKVFATKAQTDRDLPTLDQPPPPLSGDTLSNTEQLKYPASLSKSTSYLVNEFELKRRDRYKKFERMDDYPEISSAFDIFADDSTQKDTRNRNWVIKSKSELVIKEIEKFFETIKLEDYQWDIVRNVVKYGDCFAETIVDTNRPKLGIQRLKILNPLFIIRRENIYGYLENFLQEVPNSNFDNISYSANISNHKSKFISLDKNQIVHFRLHTSDPKYYPYGRSVAAQAISVFNSLKLMEDAMLVYRLSRAPERRVFYINTGNLPTNRAEQLIEKIKRKFKKEKFYNPHTGAIDERYNPASVDEDIFVPHRGDKETRIDVLPGAQNLGDVDDVKYFRDKLLASLKIPKDYVVEKDKSPERKANLSQLDVKFARTIVRIQKSYCKGLTTIVRRHLRIKGFPESLIRDVKVELPDPSDLFAKRKLDLEEQKARTVAAVLGTQLFSKDHIYKEFYDLNDFEIAQMKQQVMNDMQEQLMMNPPMDPNGNPSMGDDSVDVNIGGRDGLIKDKQPGSAGMDQPENGMQEDKALELVKKKILRENNFEKLVVLDRINKKLKKFKEI